MMKESNVEDVASHQPYQRLQEHQKKKQKKLEMSELNDIDIDLFIRE